jgi:hypothetical protein
MRTVQIQTRYLLQGGARTHPSIMSFNGRRYMTYRLENDPPNMHSRSAIVLLDDEYNPIPKTTALLEIPLARNTQGHRVAEDCRLFVFRNVLHIHVTNRYQIGVGELDSKGRLVRFSWFAPAEKPQKNWMFFETDGILYCINWICPQRISRVHLEYGSFHQIHPLPAGRPCMLDWKYGVPHGGTNPIRFKDLFLTFFQSHVLGYPSLLPVKSPTSGGYHRRVYFASAYVFSANPPFEPVLVPREPLLWPRIYAPEGRAPNGFDVVFPCGLQWADEDCSSVMVSWGDDLRAFISEFSITEILDVLEPLNER